MPYISERQALDQQDGCVATLVQARAAEGFQVVVVVGVQLPRQLAGDPGERDVGLGAAQLCNAAAATSAWPVMAAATVSTR